MAVLIAPLQTDGNCSISDSCTGDCCEYVIPKNQVLSQHKLLEDCGLAAGLVQQLHWRLLMSNPCITSNPLSLWPEVDASSPEQMRLYLSGAGAIMSLGLFRLISWDRVDGYFMRGSFASGGDSHLGA